ncbi:hypothetical protein GZH49_06380 [Nocardia terpenica]|uniref:hypothetical protein n=1 Tax=Nocardia terpenica TaxID=455432 RepID=UPI002FE1F4EC
MDDRECGMEQCHRPTPNVICDPCNRRLYRDLCAVGWLSRQLQVTLTRRDRLGGPYRDGGHAPETPLAYNAAASEAAYVLRDTLRAWAEELAAHTGVPFTPAQGQKRIRRTYRPTAADFAGWLAHHTARIPQLPAAAQCADEITAAVALAAATIDRRELPVFAGPCPHCEGGLFGLRDAERLHCRSCGARVARADVDVNVDDEIYRRYFEAADIVIIVKTRLGQDITTKRVHDLGYRRRNPVRHLTDTTGRKLYSAADVLAALGGVKAPVLAA